MKLSLIGVPFDLDEYHQGKGLAPAALLAAGLRERLAALGAQIEAIYSLDGPIPADTTEERLGLLLAALAHIVAESRAKQLLPIILGGDCLTALGTLAGLGDSLNTNVAWIDAHGDFNTPATTTSGYLGGMPLACATGRGLDSLRGAAGLQPALAEQGVVLLGVRDLDPAEAALLQQTAVTVISASDIERGTGDIAGAIALLGGAIQLYMHLDIDVLNNHDAPGVDYPAPGGLTRAALDELLGPIARLPHLAAVALTAVNPARDSEGRTVEAALAALETVIKNVIAARPQS